MPALHDTTPWIGFRFHVEFTPDPIVGSGGGRAETVCNGAFSEISGLEVSMEPRLIREGGLNGGMHQRAGALTFSPVVLKRGMTASRDLWRWWSLFTGTDSGGNGAMAHRLKVSITQQAADRTPLLRWTLVRAMPVKFKAGDLSARASEVSIEELHLVHEGLQLDVP